MEEEKDMSSRPWAILLLLSSHTLTSHWVTMGEIPRSVARCFKQTDEGKENLGVVSCVKGS